ncbi:hypothetical protein ABH922_003019 [Rhodococcus sp. 27YEA15]|uniref:hypothetical protein n=1 Tax=Rhodococcus sp. 27YEA15 TaxID=3156259 RepID=UPI003C7C3CEA
MTAPDPKRGKVFRVVVESYPTEDGKPFTEQSKEFWQLIVDQYDNPTDPDPTPDWVPDISEYLYTEDDGPFGHGYDSPQRQGKGIQGDVPWPPLLVVPSLTRRHFFVRSAAQVRVDQLIEWGCVARVETAEIGEWHV